MRTLCRDNACVTRTATCSCGPQTTPLAQIGLLTLFMDIFLHNDAVFTVITGLSLTHATAYKSLQVSSSHHHFIHNYLLDG